MALMEIDEQNAYSRFTDGKAVFGISSTSDIPYARLGYDGQYAAQHSHYEGEPIKTDGIAADKSAQTEITSSAPLKNSTSRVHGLKRPFRMPEKHTPVKSMAKYDTNHADVSDN